MKNPKLTQEKLLEDIAFISVDAIKEKITPILSCNGCVKFLNQKQEIVDAIIDTLREELDLSKYDLPNLLTTFKK